jgi:hypothetical protein
MDYRDNPQRSSKRCGRRISADFDRRLQGLASPWHALGEPPTHAREMIYTYTTEARRLSVIMRRCKRALQRSLNYLLRIS